MDKIASDAAKKWKQMKQDEEDKRLEKERKEREELEEARKELRDKWIGPFRRGYNKLRNWRNKHEN